MHKFNKILYQLLIIISALTFCIALIFQYQGNTRPQQQASSYLDTIYTNAINYPTMSSLLLAALGFFIISHLIFTLFDRNTLVFNKHTGNEFSVEGASVKPNIGEQAMMPSQELPFRSSISIFDAVIKSELSRLEEEVERLRENANAIALTNGIIENLIDRIESIISDTKQNLSAYDDDLPAAKKLLHELLSLSLQANQLSHSINKTIDELLSHTHETTSKVTIVINQVLMSPNEGVLPQVNGYLSEFDDASKLTNALAIKQAELAQCVKTQLNQLSDIAKETNIKSQCIINSMRDISSTKHDKTHTEQKHDV